MHSGKRSKIARRFLLDESKARSQLFDLFFKYLRFMFQLPLLFMLVDVKEGVNAFTCFIFILDVTARLRLLDFGIKPFFHTRKNGL